MRFEKEARSLQAGPEALHFFIHAGAERNGHVSLVLEHADMDMEVLIWKHHSVLSQTQVGAVGANRNAPHTASCKGGGAAID